MSSCVEVPRIVSEEEWLEARKELLVEEKELTRQCDRVALKRRQLPWVKVEKEYVFRKQKEDGSIEEKNLLDLFENREDLIVVHMMFEDTWEKPCKNCSFWADQYDGMLPHLTQKTSFVVIAKASPHKLKEIASKKGWHFPFYSYGDSSFGHDFGVEFTQAELDSQEERYNFGSLKPFLHLLLGSNNK